MNKLKILPEIEGLKLVKELGSKIEFVNLTLKDGFTLEGFYLPRSHIWEQRQDRTIVLSSEQVAKFLEKE